MRSRLIIVLIIGLLSLSLTSNAIDVPKVKKHRIHLKKHPFKFLKKVDTHNKWIAAGLDVSLGLFGVHRLYLGTEVHVPVMYTLTLGGGGILILADLGIILFSKDIENYANSNHIFMWSK